MTKDTKEFSNAVAQELSYYVYRLIDPRNGETFYVGKGKNNRVFAHIYDELELPEVAPEEGEEDWISEKIRTIREIRLAGLDVMHIIHRHGMDEKTAFEVEAALIDVYSGLANEMRGHHAARGPANATQLIRAYGAEEMKIDPDHKLLIIKTSLPVVTGQGSVYEAVRKSWRINTGRAEQADYVLGVVDNVCRDVFIAEKWTEISDGRYGFEGRGADDEIQRLYRDKRIPQDYQGGQIRIRYINC